MSSRRRASSETRGSRNRMEPPTEQEKNRVSAFLVSRLAGESASVEAHRDCKTPEFIAFPIRAPAGNVNLFVPYEAFRESRFEDLFRALGREPLESFLSQEKPTRQVVLRVQDWRVMAPRNAIRCTG